MIFQNELPDGYEMVAPLGRGGNAKVAHVRYCGQEYALKLLDNNYKKPESSTYRRFVNEIQALRQLQNDTGVMRVVDCNLPEQPTKTDRPWYTMPIATPIGYALGKSPSLHSCIEAVADISDTLVRLKARNFSHRDLKPDNLFQLCGLWVVGDFGLAAFPNSIEGVTEKEGRPLGSRQFMAPEMSTDAVNASPYPADVWSLAKTLWSLSTGNPFPSYLPFDLTNDGLAAYGVDDPRSHLIDRVLERATARAPDDRIPIEDIAAELRQWLSLADHSPTELEVGDLAENMRILMRPEIDKKHATAASTNSATEAMNALAPRIVELRNTLAAKYGSRPTEAGYVDDVSFGDLGFTFQFCEFGKRDGFACREAFFSVNATSPATHQLRCAVMIQVMPDLQHRLYAQLVTNANGNQEIFWEAQHTVPYGMPQQQAILNELIDNMIRHIRPALVRLNELIESGIQ